MEQGTTGQEQRGKVRPQLDPAAAPRGWNVSSHGELCHGALCWSFSLAIKIQNPLLLHGHPELRSTSGAATQVGLGPEFTGHGIPQGQDTLA